ncbi:hypothetical protein ACJX0J_038067 [Zea mays]
MYIATVSVLLLDKAGMILQPFLDILGGLPAANVLNLCIESRFFEILVSYELDIYLEVLRSVISGMTLLFVFHVNANCIRYCGHFFTHMSEYELGDCSY